ncbi:hypothetical protein BCR36DRAFT_342675 [Piromyces finnis]|uniref:SH3 domain-containing protein n=1 Tax=Piromyces finnis TaxID=1754191 RepID=A0A1Y1VMQ4_9FUNG|nr:hypothetical protein BCR36DRAFT_342675 [Piromyces finnis]|eukprot:ORX60197.1 hypothetical protein BCR36DRAFT_342675 [Piromyces finnis]
MNSTIFNYTSLLILSVIWYISLVSASNFRPVKTYQFAKDEYYDTIKYEWDITPTDKVGMFDYSIQSNGAVSTLLMNSTDYNNWQNKYYPEWLKKHEYTFTYLNDDFRTFQCKSPVAACARYDIKFPDKKLYVVVLRTTLDADITYTFEDDLERLKSKSAKLIYDPKYASQNAVAATTINKITSTTNVPSSQTISSTVNNAVPPQTNSSSIEQNSNQNNGSNEVNDSNNINNNDNTDNSENKNGLNDIEGSSDNNKDINIKDNENNNEDEDKSKSKWLWPLIVFGTLFLLLLIALLYAFMNRKKRNEIDTTDNTYNNKSCELYYKDAQPKDKNLKAKIPYNPHHIVKRVAFNYKSDDIVIERDSILEINKRYNDGWAAVINPEDGKECLIPLIILEGDINEDMTNIPIEEKSSKNILATPESLYENKYISQKDYEEMKRNNEWIKNVKLMKYGKSDTNSEQIKFISHPVTETIENDISQSRTNDNRKSMVATVVNSNTELLSADHILEVCEEDEYDYEPEQGIIMKDDL